VTEAGGALCVVLILIGSGAIGGLALINTGLGRSRNAAHAMLASLCSAAVAAAVYFICGFAWQSFPGRPSHAIVIAGKSSSWIAAERFFFRGLDLDGSPASLAAWLGIIGVALAAQIPLGAGGERWKLGPSCASTALLAGLAYPLFGHWVWGGGWLAQLGDNYGLGRGLVDAGGSGAIHGLGGMAALAIAWILGPRRGKYMHDGMPAAIPGHSTVIVLHAGLDGMDWAELGRVDAVRGRGGWRRRSGRVEYDTLRRRGAAHRGAVDPGAIRPAGRLSLRQWLG
jgi:Amt family ammonium transporter